MYAFIYNISSKAVSMVNIETLKYSENLLKVAMK